MKVRINFKILLIYFQPLQANPLTLLNRYDPASTGNRPARPSAHMVPPFRVKPDLTLLIFGTNSYSSLKCTRPTITSLDMHLFSFSLIVTGRLIERCIQMNLLAAG